MSAATRKGKGLVRVSAYLFVLLFITFMTSFQSARAGAADGALEFGKRLSPFAQSIPLDGDIAPVSINGEKIYLSHASSEEDPKTVLDRFESHCAGDPGALGALWKDVTRSELGAKSLSRVGSFMRMGTLRSGTDREGVVLCLVKGSGTPTTFADAVKAFARTSDLGALGKLRYAYVTQGASHGSQVVAAWTDDSFDFRKVFPSEGREPNGSDPSGIARIPNSKRIFSATIDGAPFSLRVYRSAESTEAAIKHYETAFDARGWLTIERPVPNTEARGFVDPGGSMVIVTALKDPDSADTLVSFGEMGIPTERAQR